VSSVSETAEIASERGRDLACAGVQALAAKHIYESCIVLWRALIGA